MLLSYPSYRLGPPAGAVSYSRTALRQSVLLHEPDGPFSVLIGFGGCFYGCAASRPRLMFQLRPLQTSPVRRNMDVPAGHWRPSGRTGVTGPSQQSSSVRRQRTRPMRQKSW